jgi:hypothetical protein
VSTKPILLGYLDPIQIHISKTEINVFNYDEGARRNNHDHFPMCHSRDDGEDQLGVSTVDFEMITSLTSPRRELYAHTEQNDSLDSR